MAKRIVVSYLRTGRNAGLCRLLGRGEHCCSPSSFRDPAPSGPRIAPSCFPAGTVPEGPGATAAPLALEGQARTPSGAISRSLRSTQGAGRGRA